MVRAAYGHEGAARTAAVLVDWWLQAALGDSALGIAWRLGDNLTETAALVQALDAVLEHQGASPALRQLRQPGQFVIAREHLRELSERTVKFNKNPAPEIYGEAREQAWQLIHRADDPSQGPVRDLRLLVGDIEEWASETRGSPEALQRRLKVWNHLVKRLDELQRAARTLVEHWTDADPVEQVLPADWRSWLDGPLVPCSTVAEAVLWDVAAVVPAFEEEPPAILRAGWLLDELRAVPNSLPVEERVALLTLAREALDDDPEHQPPDWVEATAGHLAVLRGRIRSLKTRADSQGNNEVSHQLDEALSSLDRLDVHETSSWIEYAEETLEEGAQAAVLERMERDVATWQSELEAVGPSLVEIPTQLSDVPVEERHTQLASAWSDVITKLRGRHTELVGAVLRLGVRAAVADTEAALVAAEQALEDGKPGTSRQLLDDVDESIRAAQRALDEQLLPELRDIKRRAGEAEFHDLEIASLRAQLYWLDTQIRAGHEHPRLQQAIDELVQAAEGQHLDEVPYLGVVLAGDADEAPPRIRVTHWLDSGVKVEPSRLGGVEVELPESLGPVPDIGALVTLGGQPGWIQNDDGHLRFVHAPSGLPPSRWADVVPVSTLAASPSQVENRQWPWFKGLTEVFFLTDGSQTQGPYRRVGDSITTEDARGFVARLGADVFAESFRQLEIEGPAGEFAVSRPLVHIVPTLDELLDSGAEPIDNLDTPFVDVWLADLLRDVPDIDIERIAQAITSLERRADDLPRAIYEQRLSMLNELLEVSPPLAAERHRVAKRFLTTETGQREIEHAVARRVVSDPTHLSLIDPT